MAKEKGERPRDKNRSADEQDTAPGVMVVVVPLEPSPFAMPEDSYDFTLPLFGGTIPRREN
jgi:hypothetical protein